MSFTSSDMWMCSQWSQSEVRDVYTVKSEECVCVCVCVCVYVDVLFRKQICIMTWVLQRKGDLWEHFQCPHDSKGLKIQN